MYPICNHFVHSLKYSYTGSPSRDLKAYREVVSVAKLLAINARLAAEALRNGRLAEFDPIVHENSCQIRALFVILYSTQVAQEAREMERVWQREQKKQCVRCSGKHRRKRHFH